jgi:chromosome segregation ATPase
MEDYYQKKQPEHTELEKRQEELKRKVDETNSEFSSYDDEIEVCIGVHKITAGALDINQRDIKDAEAEVKRYDERNNNASGAAGQRVSTSRAHQRLESFKAATDPIKERVKEALEEVEAVEVKKEKAKTALEAYEAELKQIDVQLKGPKARKV